MKLIAGILSLIFVLASASPSFRGIAPRDEAMYKSAIIKCKDGSKSFTSAQLNDDFCDCLDGTDEPGTSACGEGRFECRNAGHAAKVIFSSRVDDGICDCCDGSDESPEVRCPNSCWEQGKAARLKLRNKISTFRDGVSIRNRLIADAKAFLARDNADLSSLQAEQKTLTSLVDHLKDQKEQLDKAEEKARLLKEQQDKADKADKEAENIQNKEEIENVENKDEIENVENGDDVENVEKTHEIEDEKNKDDQPQDTQEDKEKEEVEEEKKEEDNEDLTKGNDDADELSREELGRLVASRWTGENTEKQAEDDVSTAKDSEEDHVPDSYASETDEEHQRYDDDEDFKEEDPEDSPSSYRYDSHDDDESHFSDTASPSSPSLLEKLQQKLKTILKSVSIFQTPVNQSDAAHIRKEYDESSAKLSKIQSQISSLTQKLKHDFGPDKEFYSFYDKCFESKENKYVYKVCPFKHASQEEGHSSTRLGRWEKFDNSYKVMIFSNGDKCWNGPDRSLTVKLRCGLKNEVTDVDEPSRCEYVALLSTPAVCFEDRLKELEHKLEEMNKDQPEKHDEL